MGSIHQCYHSPLHKKQESKIYLWRESNQCVDPEFDDPSKGTELWKSTWNIQELPVCHLTAPNTIKWGHGYNIIKDQSKMSKAIPLNPWKVRMRETFFLTRALGHASLISPTTPCSLEGNREWTKVIYPYPNRERLTHSFCNKMSRWCIRYKPQIMKIQTTYQENDKQEAMEGDSFTMLFHFLFFNKYEPLPTYH